MGLQLEKYMVNININCICTELFILPTNIKLSNFQSIIQMVNL